MSQEISDTPTAVLMAHIVSALMFGEIGFSLKQIILTQVATW
jgi:hypothetical protein